MLSPGNEIAVTVKVDRKEADLMLQAIEQTLMGRNLFMYLRDNMQPYLRLRARRRFQSEGDDASGQWAPLQEVTNDIRDVLGFPREHPINRRTGELERFMTNGVIDFDMTPTGARMVYPGRPPTKRIREKLTTAQKGKVKPATTSRPVVAANIVDMTYFLNNFAFWFGREVQQRRGVAGGLGVDVFR